MTLGGLVAEARRLSVLIDNGVAALRTSAKESADAEWTYRKARAKAWLETDGTAKQREDEVNAATADERRVRDLAEAGRQAALEALRSRRQQLSAVQTLVQAARSELDHSKYGPDLSP
jgi:hypothetical protein